MPGPTFRKGVITQDPRLHVPCQTPPLLVRIRQDPRHMDTSSASKPAPLALAGPSSSSRITIVQRGDTQSPPLFGATLGCTLQCRVMCGELQRNMVGACVLAFCIRRFFPSSFWRLLCNLQHVSEETGAASTGCLVDAFGSHTRVTDGLKSFCVRPQRSKMSWPQIKRAV